MANLKNVIYLSNEDYETLVSTGTVTIDGETLTYDENNVYVTPDKLASSTEDGLMSATDKSKLDNIESGAEVNVQADWNQTNTSADDYIKNKPTIPTVNNATLTIQKNGTTVNTFTANASSNVTANITVPTTLDDISDGSTRKLANYLPLSGGSVTGDLKLYVASGDSPRLIFQRGTLTDTYNDWSLYDSSGYLYIQQRGSGSTDWETRATFDQSGVNFAGTISENGTTLSNKYLGKSAKAADSELLDGHDSSYFATASSVPTTYLKSASVSGTFSNTLTISKQDDSTVTFYNYFHSPTYSTGLSIASGRGVNDLYVPEASTTSSGVISTSAQTFVGIKTFKSTALTSYGAVMPDTSSYTANKTLATTDDIPTTYLKSASKSGNTLTITPNSGTAITYTPSFTDTNYYAKSSYTSSNGTKIATGYSGSSTSTTYDLYVPNGSDSQAGILQLGTSATTAAKGNHAHTASIASGGSGPTALSAGTTYTLTAGGSTVVFTTPADAKGVTSVATSGTGLSGGTITSTGTITLDSSSAGNAVANKVVLRNAAGSIQTEKLAVSSGTTTKSILQYNLNESIDETILKSSTNTYTLAGIVAPDTTPKEATLFLKVPNSGSSNNETYFMDISVMNYQNPDEDPEESIYIQSKNASVKPNFNIGYTDETQTRHKKFIVTHDALPIMLKSTGIWIKNTNAKNVHGWADRTELSLAELQQIKNISGKVDSMSDASAPHLYAYGKYDGSTINHLDIATTYTEFNNANNYGRIPNVAALKETVVRLEPDGASQNYDNGVYQLYGHMPLSAAQSHRHAMEYCFNISNTPNATYIPQYNEAGRLKSNEPHFSDDVATKNYTDATIETTINSSFRNNIALEYSSSSTYAIGDKVIHNGQLYTCVVAITRAEAWNTDHWAASKVSSSFVDLDTAQTITGSKTFSNISFSNTIGSNTYNSWISADLSYLAFRTRKGNYDLTQGNVIVNIPTLSSPTAQNVSINFPTTSGTVALDENVVHRTGDTMTGGLMLNIGSGYSSSPNLVFVTSNGAGSFYKNNETLYFDHTGVHSYTLTFPMQTGTVALTSQIPPRIQILDYRS